MQALDPFISPSDELVLLHHYNLYSIMNEMERGLRSSIIENYQFMTISSRTKAYSHLKFVDETE